MFFSGQAWVLLDNVPSYLCKYLKLVSSIYFFYIIYCFNCLKFFPYITKKKTKRTHKDKIDTQQSHDLFFYKRVDKTHSKNPKC